MLLAESIKGLGKIAPEDCIIPECRFFYKKKNYNLSTVSDPDRFSSHSILECTFSF